MADPSEKARRSKIRCAIYTRKSTEEGLEQEFNSLDAQGEACSSYIASQRHEGWVALQGKYDDGGISGGTMARPALQRLLADITDGKVDVVVVYKVDRLTRSLADFAKMVELFDGKSVSFVSVTQAFNTTTSMGRLTLNVLLSFAQFEREVTGERIRDKIAASKKKGMWMGGQLPLGYDVKDRKLVKNEAEATTVRHIFARYVALRSVRLLRDELASLGMVGKSRVGRDGQLYGGRPLQRGALYHMLANRIYRGEIVHKGAAYPGEHEAIIDQPLWDEVQQVLANNRIARKHGATAEEPSLLAGLLYEADGSRMTPTHAVKAGKRYRYYVSRQLTSGERRVEGRRIPAPDIERVVTASLMRLMSDPTETLALFGSDMSAPQQRQLADCACAFAAEWDGKPAHLKRAFLQEIAGRIEIHPDKVDIAIDPARLLINLVGEGECGPVDTPSSEPIVLSVPAVVKRAGIEMKMVLTDGSEPDVINTALVRLIARAHKVRNRLHQDTRLTIGDLAAEEGVGASYLTRLLRLGYLAPSIVSAIMEGRQPVELTVRKLMDDTRLPLDWDQQAARLGFSQ